MQLISLALLAASLFPNVYAHRRSFGTELSHQKFEEIAFKPFAYSNFLFEKPVGDTSDIVESFLNDRFQLSSQDYIIKDIYRSSHNKVTHVYLRQVVNGLEVSNGDMNINIDKNGRVISFGNSFYQGQKPSSIHPSLTRIVTEKSSEEYPPSRILSQHQRQQRFRADADLDTSILTPQEALSMLYAYLELPIPMIDFLHIVVEANTDTSESKLKFVNAPFAKSDVPVKPVYVQINNGTEIRLAWDVELELEENWYHGQIDAEKGDIHTLVDWVADAQYNVYPVGINDPNEGSRQVLDDPAHKNGSPLGWHDQGNGNTFTVTAGNNVYAQENLEGGDSWESNYRPDGGDELVFNFTLNLRKNPRKYLDAAITNLFYVNNIIHDLFYQYGFNEESGNFQENNFGKGGIGSDPVIANAQDGSGYNNANFATPPDGRNGKMRMYVWNVVKPYRDGDFESGIIIHEYCHGISTRLTGGPANSGCLGWGEAGGMGEGWGDFFATVLRMRPEHNRSVNFDMGSYANGGNGIRKYKYSTNMKTNPETYGVMDNPGYWGVHAKGAVWAEMLYEVYWNLIDKLGFTTDWYSASREFGNTLMFQLVVDGMKFQPCRPSFIDARDAILQAELQLTNGAHACEIWKGFAKRGLGVGAKVGGIFKGRPRTESYETPPTCV